MSSFGALFGRLVREKRGIEGLSQDELSARTELTKARISDIETGKIANPQAKTVDALCVALNISRSERAGCHAAPASGLPQRLLENLARHFDVDMPEATEEDLEAFLIAKSEEFREMRQRLRALAFTEGRISELLNAANAALEEGRFETADDLLEDAEAIQMKAVTVLALKKQAEIRIVRGKSALVYGEIKAAADHFERSSLYFSGVEAGLEAQNRHECASQLRYYGYRYKNAEALFQAKDALQRNLDIWEQSTKIDQWCMTKIALGGTSWRLSQFDLQDNAKSHLVAAKIHYQDVLAQCSKKFMPEIFALASLDLANVYADQKMAVPEYNYELNLTEALSLQMSTLSVFDKIKNPREWGIVQHNLSCTYIALSRIRIDQFQSYEDTESAVRHARLSLDVRDPENTLQYWVAYCRTLAEALLDLSSYQSNSDADQHAQRASVILQEAAAKISLREHPHQWEQIQLQLSRINGVDIDRGFHVPS